MVIDEAQSKKFLNTLTEEGNKELTSKKSSDDILDNK